MARLYLQLMAERLAAEIATEPLGASKTNLFELEQSQ